MTAAVDALVGVSLCVLGSAPVHNTLGFITLRIDRRVSSTSTRPLSPPKKEHFMESRTQRSRAEEISSFWLLRMELWVVLLMSHCCLGLNGAAADSTALDRIQRCGTRCSQGLQCKTKPDNWFPPACQTPPEGLNTSSVFSSIHLSTVMSCKGRQKCSLRLRIKATVRLTEAVRGVSVCTVTAGMMPNCQIISFRRESRDSLSGLHVEVENDCNDISPSQHVQVTVKTEPSYCGVTWTGTYRAPECNNQDLRKHVPECITGRISYEVNAERKQLEVGVSDMLENHDYNLRLCHKDFICKGTGTQTQIKKGEPVKSATLPYSRPLPCLCIEGWSAVMDAPRVQVCPFKDRVEELWFGINFDPQEETLWWQPACPLKAVVSLCQRGQDGVCVDLPHASHNASRGKIMFTKVDPHPQLCMKFTTGAQAWTRCPFADARFQAWEVTVSRPQGEEVVKMSSQISAAFSVDVCLKSEASTECQLTHTHTIHVDKHKPVDLDLAGEQCDSCVQVRRVDVAFSATVVHCLQRCNDSSTVRAVVSSRASWVVVVPAAIFLSGIIIVTLMLHALLTMYQRRKQKGCVSKKQTAPTSDCVVSVFEARPQILVPDSPQCGNTEKANLISD